MRSEVELEPRLSLTIYSSQAYLRSGSRERSTAWSCLSPAFTACSYPSKSPVRAGTEYLGKPLMLTSCRQPGQGGDADTEPRDLRAELLAAELLQRDSAFDVVEDVASDELLEHEVLAAAKRTKPTRNICFANISRF